MHWSDGIVASHVLKYEDARTLVLYMFQTNFRTLLIRRIRTLNSGNIFFFILSFYIDTGKRDELAMWRATYLLCNTTKCLDVYISF